jgi:hypothetical protein
MRPAPAEVLRISRWAAKNTPRPLGSAVVCLRDSQPIAEIIGQRRVWRTEMIDLK